MRSNSLKISRVDAKKLTPEETNDQVLRQELELVRTLVTEKVKAGQLRLNYL